ncbi:MAG: DUF6488 family protein [Motiliproteus sp.]|nr:DUF6488 family protein [Motiliproteus sp.]MCW9053162.1 DUF6488 family protein [Motiliproteus sp.]
MRLFKLIAVLLFSLWGTQLSAGTGHSHAPVDANKASTIATKVVSTLVKNNVIESSWNTVKIGNIEQKAFGSNREWVATFSNPQITDKSKQTLYIFLTLSGEYLAANYTGK